MAASEREVWSGAQLRILLAVVAGAELSAASLSSLFFFFLSQFFLFTLSALFFALFCSPNDLFDVDTIPV